MDKDEEPKGDLVFQDYEAIIVTSEWNGKPKIISVSLDLIQEDAGCEMCREEALDYVSANSDHYVELAREIDLRASDAHGLQVEIGPHIEDDGLLYSARRRLQERRAAEDATDDIAAKLHYELSELHARRMHKKH